MANVIELIAKFINEASGPLKGLGDDVEGVGKKSEETTKKTDGFSSSIGDLAKQFGITLSVTGALAAGFAFLKSSIDAYGESEVVAAQVNAVLQSTNQIAGVTAQEIDKIATSLSDMSGADDEAIKRGEALMLTFTKVGKEVFPQATEAALNMSMAMGTDLQSAIMQVGKALNEPIQGAAALRRIGVQLTDAQEAQIKSFMAVNDIASAQAIILGELQTEFGGVAEAMGNTTVGSANKLKTAWGNLQEAIGAGLAPQMKEFNEGLADNLNQMTENINEATKYSQVVMTVADAHGMTYDQMTRARTASEEFNLQIETQIDGLQRVAAAEQHIARDDEYISHYTRANDAVNEYIPNFTKLLDLSTSVTDETERYNQKQSDLVAKQAEVQGQIDTLIAQGWSPLSQKVQDLQKDYDDLGVKYDENAQKHAEAMDRIQYDLLITKLSVDGLDDAEYQVAQQAGLMFGVFDEKSVETARNMDLVTQAVATGKLKVEDMQRALDLLPKLKNIDVVINAIANIPGTVAGANPQTQKGGYAYQGYNNKGYADGGISTGSNAGHWELLHGTEAIIPLQNGSVPVQFAAPNAGMSGSNITVVVQVNSPINLMSENEAQNVLMPMIVQAVKQAEAEARL